MAYGSTKVLTLSVALGSLVTIGTPFAARWSLSGLIACRALTGFFHVFETFIILVLAHTQFSSMYADRLVTLFSYRYTSLIAALHLSLK